MRILIVGSGGVGGAAALIAADRDFYDLLVLADCDAERAAAAAEAARAGRRTLQLGEEAGGRIRRLSKRSWLILAGIAVLTVGGLWWWLRPEPVKPILPVVQVEPAETDDIELYGEYVGRIRAQQFVEIRARVEGFLEKMLFEEGTYVKKGQPLFIIDPKLYEARVNKAKAQLNKDKALELKADIFGEDGQPSSVKFENRMTAKGMIGQDVLDTRNAMGRHGIAAPHIVKA